MTDSNFTDIAVLKTEVAGLHAAINEVGTKMDKLLDIHIKLSVQDERLEHLVQEHGRSRDMLNKEMGVLEIRADTVGEHSRNTRDRLDAWLNRMFGGFAVGALLMGAIQYTVISKLSALDIMVEAVQKNTAGVAAVQNALNSHLSRANIERMEIPGARKTQLESGDE